MVDDLPIYTVPPCTHFRSQKVVAKKYLVKLPINHKQNKTHVSADIIDKVHLEVHILFLYLQDGCCVRSIHLFTSRETDAILYSIQKTSWADDVEDLGEHFRSLF